MEKSYLKLLDNNKKWVELPMCDADGADTSKPLDADLGNATYATCKKKKKEYIMSLDPVKEIDMSGKSRLVKW